MSTALQAITLGVLLGITYGLLAMGLSLIFGVIRLANFSHGEFYMIGGYVFVLVAPFLSSVGGIAAAMAACTGLAWILHRVLLQPKRWSAFSGFSYNHYMLVVTFSAAVVSRSAASALTGGRPWHPGPIVTGNVSVFGLSLPLDRILVAAVALVGIGGLVALVRYTSMGRAWRAIAQNSTGAQVVGVNFARSARLGFAIACGLAGVAGALL
ncbi:MAG TPA: branched-chain amino acid ABC transporter permease, partial [Propionibacteriaceae bacterium]